MTKPINEMTLNDIELTECIWGSRRIMVSWADLCNYAEIDPDKFADFRAQRVEDGVCSEDVVYALGRLLDREGYAYNASRCREISQLMLKRMGWP